MPHGSDLRYDLTITFEEAVFGCQKEIVLLRYERCPACHASGAESGTPLPLYSACQGTAKVRRVQKSIVGQCAMDTPRERCYGRGKVITTRWKQSHGEGQVLNTRRVVVNIPTGVDDEVNVRMTGEGEVRTYGFPPSNLYVVLTVKPHPFFKCQRIHTPDTLRS